MPSDNPHRLSRNAAPHRYDLTLRPDIDDGSFTGEVTIGVTVAEPTTTVTLNAAELEITSVAATWGEANGVAPAGGDEKGDGSAGGATDEGGNNAVTLSGTAQLDEEAERATLSFPSALPAGEAQLHLTFTGVLNDKLRGFYRSTYDDPTTGEPRLIATTQFESTNARRAFPCFDEPDLKAVFGVTLETADGLTAVSCGQLLETTPLPDGRTAHRFGDTMTMSTYLLAFIVGHLVATEPVDVDGVPLRVLAVPGKQHLCDFGLEVGEFSLRWLTDYFGIRYPAEKLDLVAVPDFAFGAMENMGCVTFRETLLLADPQRTGTDSLSRIVDVVAHEIAHMWFGNLVTMDWWNGIWLKEAFATFMQMATTHAYRPQWNRWDEFSLERGAALDVDSLASTRPIEYEVVSPADAEGMYDLLTYEKGAAVVRMLEQYLGPDEFRAGVRSYLTRHSYGNVTTTDLWDALEASSGQPVRAAMDSWIFQGGYPVLAVERAEGAAVRLSQRRFSYGADAPVEGAPMGGPIGGESDGGRSRVGAASTLGESWHVPVILRAALSASDGSVEPQVVTRRVLLQTDEMIVEMVVPLADELLADGAASGEVPAGGHDTVDWVVANAGGHGYYRVGYSEQLLGALTRHAFDALEPIERYSLVDDTFAAVLAGQADAQSFVALVVGLVPETDLRVWQRMLGGLSTLRHVADDAGREHLSRLIRNLANTALGVLGREPVDGESDLDRQLRAALVAAAGVEGRDEALLGFAREWFTKASAVHGGSASAGTDSPSADADAGDPDGYDPELAMACVSVVAALGGTEDDYEAILKLHREATVPQAKQRFLWALLNFDDAELFDRTLTLARTEVRTQDAPYLLGAAMGHATLGGTAWEMIRRRWDELCERFPVNAIARMVGGVRALSTPQQAADVEAFFAEHPVPQGELIVAQHLEKMRVNVALREREGSRLAHAPTSAG